VATIYLPRDVNGYPACAFNQYLEYRDESKQLNLEPDNTGMIGEDLIIYANPGFLSKVINFYFYIPGVPEATTGKHGIAIYSTQGGEGDHIKFFEKLVEFNEKLYLTRTDLAEFEAYFTSDVGFGIFYHNSTDAVQTEKLTRRLVILHQQTLTR
jgi:hypothetical protein